MIDESQRPLEVVEAVLKTPFFYDQDRTTAALNRDFEVLDAASNEDRLWMYTTALRGIARARHNSRRENGLTPQAEILDTPENPELASIADRLAIINHFEQYVAECADGTRELGLYEQQIPPFDSVLEHLRKDVSNFYHDEAPTPLTKNMHIVLPTAFGKTAILTKAAQAMGVGSLELPGSQKKLRALVITPNRQVMHQNAGINDAASGFSKFAPEMSVSRYYDEEKNLRGDVVVVTIQSFLRLAEHSPQVLDEFPVVMVDELHRMLGKRRSAALKEYFNDRIVLGFTATPSFSISKTVDSLLPVRIYEERLETAIQKGYINGLELYAYSTNQRFALDSLTPSGEISQADLTRMAENEVRNNMTIDIVADLVGQGMRGLVSCNPGSDCAHARHLAERLSQTTVQTPDGERPIRAAAVGSFLDDDENQLLLQKFREGDIDALLYVSMLDEGYDQKIDFLVNTSPTLSKVRATQRLGRALRLNPGRPHTIVIELVDVLGRGAQQITPWHILGQGAIVQGQRFGTPQKRYNRWHGAAEHEPVVVDYKVPAELKDACAKLDKVLLEELMVGATMGAPEGWLTSHDLVTYANGEREPEQIRQLLLKAKIESIISFNSEAGRAMHYFNPDAIEYLQNNTYEEPPEGYEYASQIAGELGFNTDRIVKAANKLGVSGKVYWSRKSGNNLIHYSPEESTLISSFVLKTTLQPPASDERERAVVAAEYGIDEALIAHYFRKNGLPLLNRRGPGGYKKAYVKEADVQRALTYLTTPELPVGEYRTKVELERHLGTSAPVIERIVGELGFEPTTYRAGANEKRQYRAAFFSPDQIAMISQALARERAQKIAQLAVDASERDAVTPPTATVLSPDRVVREAPVLPVSPPTIPQNTRPSSAPRPRSRAALAGQEAVIPNDYQSVNDVAVRLNTIPMVIMRLVRNAATPTVRDIKKAHGQAWISAQAARYVERAITSLPLAGPESYSLVAAAELLKLSQSVFEPLYRDYLARTNTPPRIMKNPVTNRVELFLTMEDIIRMKRAAN